jgi:DNA polymerase-3 subunit delta
MKLSWKEIEPFVKRPDARARAILIYGPDDGLMRERSGTIGKTIVADLNDPFNVAVLSSETLSGDPARLADEAMAMSMIGGARLIRIEGASDKLTVLLKEYLASPSHENLVIVETGELGPRSSLRLLFEKAPNAAAIPCYVEDERAVMGLIREIVSADGMTIQNDACAWLSQNISGDRRRARGEVEKLILYMGAQKNIKLDDVMAACGEAGDQSLDDLIYCMGAGKTDAALRAYTKLIGEGVAMITILRSLQNHFRRLHYIRAVMEEEGASADEAMKKLQPPIFFKNTDPFKAQLRKWSDDKLLAILTRLSAVEAQTKQTGAPAETLGAQVILSLSA